MNQEPDMSIDDTENNNLDVNSNDHQYDQFINYHNQFRSQFLNDPPLHHDTAVDREDFSQRQLHRLQAQAHVQAQAQAHAQAQAQAQALAQAPAQAMNRPQINDLPNLASASRAGQFLHRRHLSEDLSYNSDNLHPLPRNDQNGARSSFPNSNNRWLPTLRPRRRPPSVEDIQIEGEELLCNFAAEQFREEEIDFYMYVEPRQQRPIAPSWKRAGRDLRILADEFSRSQERKELRRKANEVNMTSLTFENFIQLCSELFRIGEGGVTQERIVVLFTFISDMAIHQVHLKAEHFIKTLMQWSLKFIWEHICSLVQEAGGWSVVLSRGANFIYKCTLFVCAAFSIAALGVYIAKNSKSL